MSHLAHHRSVPCWMLEGFEAGLDGGVQGDGPHHIDAKGRSVM